MSEFTINASVSRRASLCFDILFPNRKNLIGYCLIGIKGYKFLPYTSAKMLGFWKNLVWCSRATIFLLWRSKFTKIWQYVSVTMYHPNPKSDTVSRRLLVTICSLFCVSFVLLCRNRLHSSMHCVDEWKICAIVIVDRDACYWRK